MSLSKWIWYLEDNEGLCKKSIVATFKGVMGNIIDSSAPSCQTSMLWVGRSAQPSIQNISIWLPRIKTQHLTNCRHTFNWGNLANVEVLLLVCCYLNVPNTCPFAGTMDGWLFACEISPWCVWSPGGSPSVLFQRYKNFYSPTDFLLSDWTM